jgi:hypothetical protein
VENSIDTSVGKDVSQTTSVLSFNVLAKNDRLMSVNPNRQILILTLLFKAELSEMGPMNSESDILEKVVVEQKSESKIWILWKLFLNSSKRIINENTFEKKTSSIICVTPALCVILVGSFLLEKENKRSSELLRFCTEEVVALIKKIEAKDTHILPGSAYVFGFLLQIWFSCVVIYSDSKIYLGNVNTENCNIDKKQYEGKISSLQDKIQRSYLHILDLLPSSFLRVLSHTGLWEPTFLNFLMADGCSYSPIYFSTINNGVQGVKNGWKVASLLDCVMVLIFFF